MQDSECSGAILVGRNQFERACILGDEEWTRGIIGGGEILNSRGVQEEISLRNIYAIFQYELMLLILVAINSIRLEVSMSWAPLALKLTILYSID